MGKCCNWEVYHHTTKWFNNNIEQLACLGLELRHTTKRVYKIPTVMTFLLRSFNNFKPTRVSKIPKNQLALLQPSHLTASGDKTNDVTTRNVAWYQLHKNLHNFCHNFNRLQNRWHTKFSSEKLKLMNLWVKTIYVDTIPKLWSILLKGHKTNIKKINT